MTPREGSTTRKIDHLFRYEATSNAAPVAHHRTHRNSREPSVSEFRRHQVSLVITTLQTSSSAPNAYLAYACNYDAVTDIERI